MAIGLKTKMRRKAKTPDQKPGHKDKSGYTRPPATGSPVRDQKSLKFREEYYYQAYALACEGHSEFKIGQTLGLDPHTFRKWRRMRPALAKAIEAGYLHGRRTKGGKKDPNKGANSAFFNYVYKRLPEKLLNVWKRIIELGDETPRERLEACMTDLGKRERQHLFFHALVSCNFVVSQALRMVNVSHVRFDRWKDDPEFAELASHFDEMKKDYVEGALFGLIAQGDVNAIIYANRCLNRDRGYDPKTRVEVTGTIAHVHDKIAIEDLAKLSPDDKRKMLEALRSGRKEPQPIQPSLPMPQGQELLPAEG